MKNHRAQYLASLLLSVVLALLVGAIIMAATGHSPMDGYGALMEGALGNKRGWGNTLYKTAQLCITGLATAVAAQAGISTWAAKDRCTLARWPPLISARAWPAFPPGWRCRYACWPLLPPARCTR